MECCDFQKLRWPNRLHITLLPVVSLLLHFTTHTHMLHTRTTHIACFIITLKSRIHAVLYKSHIDMPDAIVKPNKSHAVEPLSESGNVSSSNSLHFQCAPVLSYFTESETWCFPLGSKVAVLKGKKAGWMFCCMCWWFSTICKRWTEAKWYADMLREYDLANLASQAFDFVSHKVTVHVN